MFLYIQIYTVYEKITITNKSCLVLFLQLTITSPATPVHNWRLPPLVHWPQVFDAVEEKQLAPPCDERILTTAGLAQAPPMTSPHL